MDPMMEKTVKIPGPDHPIRIMPAPSRVTVKAGGRTIAASSKALVLAEAAYKPVYYIPREDADMAMLRPSPHTTYCPYKGECSYFSIDGLPRGENAVWSYEAPYAAVAEIEGHLAFYPDRVEISAEA